MNQLCHVEYQVTDIDRSRSFYEGLFGWTFRQFMPEMVVFGQGETHIGGLMLADRVNAAESPSLWFQVESLDESCARATALGGIVDGEKSPVPGVGWSIVVRDPDGNGVGLVQYD